MDNDLAKIRAQGDVKLLKKVIKDFYKLLSKEIIGEELQAAHETFLMDLDVLSLQLSKMSRLKYITETEVNGYESDARAIEQTHEETQEKLKILTEQLAAAQRERACRIEYDAIAKLIKAFPDRKQGEESQARLRSEIHTLEILQKTYKETWESRQSSFDLIVNSLEVMSNAIKDEKAESDRRTALEEGEDEIEVEVEVEGEAEGDGEGGGGGGGGLDPLAKSFKPVLKSTTTASGVRGETEEEGEELEEGETGVEGEVEDVEMEDVVEGGTTEIELEEGQEREEKEEGEML